MSEQGRVSAWDRRANNFDFMRLAFAVLVIYSHAFPLGTGTETNEPLMRLTHGQLTGGGLAVDSFFVMSGYLIAGSAQRSRAVWSFLRKRVTRIYPAFVVSALLSAVLLLPLSGGHFSWQGWKAAADFTLQTARLTEFHYAGAFAGNAYPGVINGSVWSIAYEFWCYVGVAILLLWGWLARRRVVAVFFIAAWFWSVVSVARHWNFGGKLVGVVLGSPQFWARLLVLYLAGVVFYLYRDRIALSGSIATAAAVAMAAACLFPLGWTCCFPVAGTYLLFWFAFGPNLGVHRFGRFGDFSYGTYLYAFPIEQMLVKWFGGIVRPVVLFSFATPLALCAAVASWYVVERRFLAPVRRREEPIQALEDTLEFKASS